MSLLKKLKKAVKINNFFFIIRITKYILDFFFPTKQQPPVGQGLLIIEVSRSYSVIPQSVGFLWTSDQLVAEKLLV